MKLKKQLFSCALLSLFILGFTLKRDLKPEKIDWNTHFFGEPDENSAYAALTVTTWNYSYKAKVKNKHLYIDFNFTAGVDVNRSWVKRDRIRNKHIRNQLLKHEQGHVYINFLMLKDSDNKIRNQQYTIGNYRKLIQQNANNLNDYYNQMQDRYDVETKHGTDLAAQKRWDEFFEMELKRY